MVFICNVFVGCIIIMIPDVVSLFSTDINACRRSRHFLFSQQNNIKNMNIIRNVVLLVCGHVPATKKRYFERRDGLKSV